MEQWAALRPRAPFVWMMLAMTSATMAQTHDPREPFAATPPAATQPAATQPAATQPTGDGPVYRIYPLRNGTCAIAGNHAFHGGDPKELYEYALYVWLVLGGDKPILVDAGLVDVEAMNRGAAKVLARPIVQKPEETVPAQLRHFGVTPADIGDVLITHLHFDHVDGIEMYPNARIHVGRGEFEGATANHWQGSWCDARLLDFLVHKARDRVRLVDDGQEVLPGIRGFWLGCHTPGSTAYQIRTAYGRTVLTGDPCSLLANFERRVPPGVYSSLDECAGAMQRIAERADVVLPSHDPDTVYRWPPATRASPTYTIRALKCGQCEVRDSITYYGSKSEATQTFFLYVWVIEGGARPILVETGPKDPEGFSRSTAKYIPGGVKQRPEERTPELLRRNGIDPADVSHVIATHLHADHYDYFDLFPNAQFVVNRHGFLEQLPRVKPEVMRALAARWPESLRLVEDEEVVPGIRAVPLGCHSPCSQAIVVRTAYGPIALTGDVAYLYENVETDRMIAGPDVGACRSAVAKLRSMTDLFLPAHDPRVLDRWPGGRIGFVP